MNVRSKNRKNIEQINKNKCVNCVEYVNIYGETVEFANLSTVEILN